MEHFINMNIVIWITEEKLLIVNFLQTMILH